MKRIRRNQAAAAPVTRARDLSRRTFLAAAISGLGAPLAWPAVARDRVHGANRRVQVGVIGCGAQGMRHIRALRDSEAVAAACDVAEAPRLRAKEACGARMFADWQDVLDDAGVDAVIIATPDTGHARIANAALAAGKHVYLETPLRPNVVAAAQLMRAAEAAPRLAVQIGAQEVSASAWREAGELIRAGRIGAIRMCQAVTAQNTRGSGGAQAAALQFPLLAAVLRTLGVSTPEHVSAAGGADSGDADLPDTLMTTLAFSGYMVTLVAGSANTANCPTIVRGADGAIILRGARAELAGVATAPVSPAQTPCADPLAAHLADWLDGIRGGATCACDPTLAWHVHAALDAALRSWRCARTLHAPEFNA